MTVDRRRALLEIARDRRVLAIAAGDADLEAALDAKIARLELDLVVPSVPPGTVLPSRPRRDVDE